MQQVNQHVDAAYLEQAPPRPLSPMLMLELCAHRLAERLSQTVLHPLFIVATAALVVSIVMRLPLVVVAVPLALVIGRLVLGLFYVWRAAWQDLRLLRRGLILRAHILKLRPNHTLSGEIDGALLDCAIVLSPQRTYVGSIWLADGNEARRLQQQQRLQVLCLPFTPGTWRVIEPLHCQVRYERVGPMTAIPPDG